MKQLEPTNRVLFVVATTGACVMAQYFTDISRPVLVIAQELEGEREEKEDDEPSLRELMEDLQEERQELKEELADAEGDEKMLLEMELVQLDRSIAMIYTALQFQSQLKEAVDNQDEDNIERLEERLARWEQQFEFMLHEDEVNMRLLELRLELKEAREDGNEPAIQQLTDVIKSQEDLKHAVHALHTTYSSGPEELEEPLEIGVEMLERIVHLKHTLFLLQEARREDPQEADEAREKQVTDLLKLHNDLAAVGRRLLTLYEDGPEDEIEPLEEEFEEIAEQLEPKWEVFVLEVELAEAREEGDEELVEELELELRALRGEKLDPPAEDDSGANAMPSVKISDADLAAVANLDFNQDVLPLLKTHCIRCHGSETQEGDLDLEQAVAELPFVRNSRLWMNVAEQTKNRVMPPADEPHPSDADRRTIAAWLTGEIRNFDYSQIKEPGYEPARRLSHQEYANTVRDLFGMPLQVTHKFPADLSGTSGFDNSANTLFIQPLLLERYMAAADEVVRQAFDMPLPLGEKLEAAQGMEEAKRIVSHYLSRAYRRPATRREIEQALVQFQAARDGGLDFEESIKNIVRASLVSPKFLLKIEATPTTEEAHEINDWELASRLSYFLWASMPDDELFRLARDKKLSDPAVLAQQISRMLDDPKAATLGTVFASQWLGFQHLGTRVRADPIDNPWCTDSLMDAMKAESAMFFVSLVRDNQPIQRLVNADYTFLNAELAKHYRLPGVEGDQMRRVELTTANRGGIFTQGSLLAVTSFPGRTSPVIRGKWILEDVLGTPPPPPPPNASDFSDEIEDRDSLTRRQKLELHRRKPNCYACHSQIDPLGFSLENYDWFGRHKTGSGRRRIDASGQLPDGTEFTGPAGLKQVIVEKRMDDLTRQLTRKMLSYALGRQLEYYDEPAVRKIIAAVEKHDYRFQTLINSVVQSYPFRYKKKLQ